MSSQMWVHTWPSPDPAPGWHPHTHQPFPSPSQAQAQQTPRPGDAQIGGSEPSSVLQFKTAAANHSTLNLGGLYLS